MSVETGSRNRPAVPPPLPPGWRRAVVATTGGVAVLGLIGFVNSFIAVSDAVAPSFTLPWTVPLGIDVAIAVFSAADLIMAKLRMRTRWLRLVPWALVAATIYLNVATETNWVGWVAHTALPALWVVAVEVGTHVVRNLADLASPRRMERIRRVRWLLAPLSTPGMYRRMVLWEMRSYDEALTLERRRLLAKAAMRESYGRFWRLSAPPTVRVLYRLGELAAAPAPQGVPPAVPAPVPPHLQVQPDGPQLRTPPPAELPDPPAAGLPAGLPAPAGAPRLHLVQGDAAPGVQPPVPGRTGRDLLAELLAAALADGERALVSNAALARELHRQAGLSETTARRYISEMRSAQ